ncbi:unnamed protein product [Mycena citricolor]|nr:unnamed protein product [Mycena citricolor]
MKTFFALGAVAGIPVYISLSLFSRRPGKRLSIERAMNMSTLSGLGAAGVGGAAVYARNSLLDADSLRQRRHELVYSKSKRREEDFAAIGSVLLACIAPAVFWGRAGLLDLTLGGFSLGYGAGTVTHHVQNLLGESAEIDNEKLIPVDDPRSRRR